MYKKGQDFFKLEAANAVVELAKRSAQAEKCSVEELKTYRTCTLAFRKHMGSLLGDQSLGFSTQLAPPSKQLAVPLADAATVNMILANIIRKRSEALGGNVNTGGVPSHYAQFNHLFDYGIHVGTIDIMARRKQGTGLTLNPDNAEEFVYLEEIEGAKTGPLLLTTAIMYHRQRTGLEDLKFLGKG